MSFVCEKHERFVPDGEECPYCEPTPLHARADGSKCLCGSPTCPNPAGLAVKEWPHFMGTPIIPWPKQLEHVPPEFRFVEAKTGKPKPLIGFHFGAVDRDACAMCGKSGMEIRQNPLTPCEYPWPPEARDPADSAWAEITQKARDVVSPDNALLKLLREKP